MKHLSVEGLIRGGFGVSGTLGPISPVCILLRVNKEVSTIEMPALNQNVKGKDNASIIWQKLGEILKECSL